MKICIVGSGYVGLVTGTCLAEVGHTVTCLDVDEVKIQNLKVGVLPIFEPGLSELVRRNSSCGRLFFTSSPQNAMQDCQAIFIAVGTPEGEDGSADLKYVKAVAKSIGREITKEILVVVKSTVPVGTCTEVKKIIESELAERKLKLSIDVASNPEFLKEGSAIEDFMHPDRIVVGLDQQQSKGHFLEIYAPFVQDDPSKILFMDVKSSELTKYASNAMLATRISFMNELAQLVDKVGGNIDEIRRGMGQDIRIGKKFLYAGPGFGGSCFPKDVEALIKTGEKHGVPLAVLTGTNAANKAHKAYVASKVLGYFGGDLTGKVVTVWGLAFKPGTDDVRDTPSYTIINMLLKAGAKVQAHDPEASDNFHKLIGPHKHLVYMKDCYTALEGSDALVLVTEWPEYKRPDYLRIAQLLRHKAIFDFRNQYRSDELKKIGFHYESIGRPGNF
jgi:UDPglucose 6-dehydrogenase